MIRVTYWKPQELEAGGGPYLCGDQYTLADISMVKEIVLFMDFQLSFPKVPIFERMELAGWWTDSLKRDFPLVLKYWETIQQRFSTLLHQFCFK